MINKDSSNKILVLDIGGTNFRTAIFDLKSHQIKKAIRSTTPNFINTPKVKINKLQQLLIEKITHSVEKFRKSYNFQIVGVSFPAPITADGLATQSPTIWGSKGQNFPILKKLQQAIPDLFWVVTNDITAAAERYANMPTYKNIDYFSVITVSSGVGHKIYDVKNQSVILDKKSIGGELGHFKFDFNSQAPKCDCGGRGHIGALSSGRAVERLVIEKAKTHPLDFKKSLLYKLARSAKRINNKLINQAITQKDKFTMEVLDKTTFPIAVAIAFMSSLVGVEKNIMIGGFALNCGQEYLRSVRRNLNKMDFFGRSAKQIKQLVDLGINDDNDALIGMGFLAYKQYLNRNKIYLNFI